MRIIGLQVLQVLLIREFWFCCIRDFGKHQIEMQLIRVFLKPWVKYSRKFFLFSPSYASALIRKRKPDWRVIQSINVNANFVRVEMYLYDRSKVNSQQTNIARVR